MKKKLKEFLELLDLWTGLVVFEIRKSNVGSALGIFWAVLEPLLFLGMYFFLFIMIMKVDQQGRSVTEMILMMFAGLVPWLFFSNCLSRGTIMFASHAPLIKQINFPIGLLPFVTVAQVAVEFLISLAMLLAMAWYAGHLHAAALLLVPAIGLFSLFLVGLSVILCCYAVVLRDLQKLIPAILRVAIFLTPVFYSPSSMSPQLRFLAYINPISYFISLFRYSLLHDPSELMFSLPQEILMCVLFTAAMLAVGAWHWKYVRRVVVDYL